MTKVKLGETNYILLSLDIIPIKLVGLISFILACLSHESCMLNHKIYSSLLVIQSRRNYNKFSHQIHGYPILLFYELHWIHCIHDDIDQVNVVKALEQWGISRWNMCGVLVSDDCKSLAQDISHGRLCPWVVYVKDHHW